MINIYQPEKLKERQDTPRVLSSSAHTTGDVFSDTKLEADCRSGNTGSNGSRSSNDNKTVFVLSNHGKPLTPTTPAKARKLLRNKVAKKTWSKFGTFGIKMLVETGNVTPKTSLGYDPGTKFEGSSVVCGNQNCLNIKWNLPDKKSIVRKMDERRNARRSRRQRLRRRPARFKNRSRKGFIAPSQMVVVYSRLKHLREVCRIYPITVVGIEDVKFNHAKKRWGANFSTVEIGKSILDEFFNGLNIEMRKFEGWQTKELREQYGYKKTKGKSDNVFTAHCSDSLSLALAVNGNTAIAVGSFMVFDDTYRYMRRKLHDSNFSVGGVKKVYSSGSSGGGVKKGRLVCSYKGEIGVFCGFSKDYRFYDLTGKRRSTKKIIWKSNKFKQIC